MKTIFLKAIVALTPILCSAVSASAEDADIPRAQKPDPRAAAKASLLERYDKNKNGRLDTEEIEAIGRDRMLENDRNKDGRVDQFELRRPRAGVSKMPPMDALQRAMARERALTAARLQVEKERAEAAKEPAQEKTR